MDYYREEVLKAREKYPISDNNFNSILDTCYVVERDDYGQETFISETRNLKRLAEYKLTRAAKHLVFINKEANDDT